MSLSAESACASTWAKRNLCLLLAVGDVTSQHVALTDKRPHSLVLAVDLGHLEVGTHEVMITLSDRGNPKMNIASELITIRVSNNTA